MVRPADKVFEAIKNATGIGDVARALAQDPYLVIGLLAILAIVLLFLRILLWPQINPFQFQWFNTVWNFAKNPIPPSPEQSYPYAKVIYPTYR